MKKLNRKGYLTIEIVIASVITFVIAFFLIDLTMKLVDNTDNAYADTLLITDKSLITSNIRKELENDMRINGNIKEVECDEYGKTCTITFNNESKRYLSINDGNILTYKDNADDETANVIYSKRIHNSLTNISISSATSYGYYNFKISGENIFMDKDYEMNINIYNESVPTMALGSTWYRGTTPRSDIKKIIFTDNYIKTGDEIEAWGAAANVNGPGFNDEIMCYIKYDGADKILIIAGNGTGKIYANENSRLLFGGSGEAGGINWFVNLTTIENLSVLDTSMVTTMYGIFAYCNSLTTLDLSGFETSNVTNMYGMFYKCKNLSYLNLNSFDTSNVIDMNYMFQECNNLKIIDLDEWDTSSVKSMIGMFYKCSELTKLNISNFNTSEVNSMEGMFSDCGSLVEIILDESNWDTSKVTNMSYMFDNCTKLKEIDVSNWEISNVTTVKAMFENCNSLTEIDISDWDASKITDMSWMFNMCNSLINLNISNEKTYNVTNMHAMFHECSSLTNLDVSKLNTSKVTDMSYMFAFCSSLTELDLSGFDTSNVTNMYGMLGECKSLTKLNVSKFNTSNVTNMGWMFGKIKVNSLDLSSFDTSKVTNMGAMFSDCDNLTTLDLSSFNMSNVEILKEKDNTGGMVGMFGSCDKLTTIYVKETPDFSKVTDSTELFKGSYKLKGGAGTTYDSNNIDATYARIDDPENGSPGYFTYKESTT